MSSINDDLMSGGLLQAALISTDANGNVTGLMGPDGELLMQFIDVGGESAAVNVEV